MANKANNLVSLTGMRVKFAYVDSPLVAAAPGKALSLGAGLVFHLDQVAKVSAVVPVPGMDADAAEAWIRSNLVVPATAGYKQAVITAGGSDRAFHGVPMTTWVAGSEPADVVVDTLAGTASVTVLGSFTEVNTRQKLTGDGVKASVSPEPGVRLTDAATGADLTVDGMVVFTPETIKGKQAFASACAEWMNANGHGRFVYNPNVGFTAEHLAWMGRYVRENSKEVVITWAIEPVMYELLRGLYGSDAAWSFEADGVVAHTVTVLFGEMVLAVEYSSTFQNCGGSQELIPEIVYGIGAIHPELGQALVKSSAGRRGNVQGMLRMLHGQGPVNARVLRLDPLVGVAFDASKSDREVAEGLAKAFPDGVVIEWDSFSQYVDLRTLIGLGAYAPGGESYGFAHELMALLRYLHVDNDRSKGDPTARMRFHFRKFQKGIKGTLANSRKTLAKAIRCGRLLGRKVDGTYRVGMGLWELHVNPADYVVTAPKGMVDGEVVLAFRVPVYNAVAWKVVLDPETPKGTFQVHPLCWHAANEGDFDGDSIAVLRLPVEFQADAWTKFHEAAAGSWRGYFNLRGAGSAVIAPDVVFDAKAIFAEVSKAPFIDFLAFSPAKKMGMSGFVAADGTMNPFSYEIETVAMLDLAELVQNHYQRTVGASYGQLSMATYLLAATRFARPAHVVTAEWATEWLTRIVHEGSSLGGYKPATALYHEGLAKSLRTKPVLVSGLDVHEWYRNGAEALEAAADHACATVLLRGPDALVACVKAGLGQDITKAQAEWLLLVKQVLTCQTDLEGRKAEPRYGDVTLFGGTILEFAAVAGMLRRASKGIQVSEFQAKADTFGEDSEGTLLVDHVTDVTIKKFLGADSAIAKIALVAKNVHSSLAAARRQIEDEQD